MALLNETAGIVDKTSRIQMWETVVADIPLANGDHDVELGPGVWRICVLSNGGTSYVLSVSPLGKNGTVCGTYALGVVDGAVDSTGGALTVTGGQSVRVFQCGAAGGTAAQAFCPDPVVINRVRVTVASITGTTEITFVACRIA